MKHFITKNKDRLLYSLELIKDKGFKYFIDEIRRKICRRNERIKRLKHFRKNVYIVNIKNKKKIVLIRPPFMPIRRGSPIGLAYIQAALKKEGHEVVVRDMNLEIEEIKELELNRDFILPEHHPIINKAYERIEEYCENILDLKPDLVGFSLSHSTTRYGLEIAKRLSKYIRCIAGGPQASFNEQALLSTGYFKAIVSGYGEEAVLEALDSNGIFSKKLIPSKTYLPDYTGITIDKYHNFLSIMTTRGCPNRCTYCTQNLQYFYHSIESVLYQIETTPNVQLIMYNDPNINVNSKRTEKLFTEISKLQEKPYSVVYGMEIKQGFERYISKMAESGVKEAGIGLESGSFAERNRMNKPHWNNDLAVAFIKELTSHKILTWAQFIFCYPDQTEKDRQETLDLMKRINDECDPNYVKIFWYKFVVHLGLEKFFKEHYGVIASSPQNWENDLYNSSKMKQLEEKYSKLIPQNAKIHM